MNRIRFWFWHIVALANLVGDDMENGTSVDEMSDEQGRWYDAFMARHGFPR